jgi:hypothetical protein
MHDTPSLTKEPAMTATQSQEFILVGRRGATSYTLWDIAPAPADLSRRRRVVEELDVEAADALGEVDIIPGATAARALDIFLDGLRAASGNPDYALAPGSNTSGLVVTPLSHSLASGYCDREDDEISERLFESPYSDRTLADELKAAFCAFRARIFLAEYDSDGRGGWGRDVICRALAVEGVTLDAIFERRELAHSGVEAD